MKRYRLTGMLDPAGFADDPEGMFVLWEDAAAAAAGDRQGRELRACVTEALPSGAHLVPGFAVNAYDACRARMAPASTDPVMAALADYAGALAAWDATPHEGVHAFESAGLDDDLRAAIRAAREVQP